MLSQGVHILERVEVVESDHATIGADVEDEEKSQEKNENYSRDWTFLIKIILPDRVIELNGQIKIIPHLPKSINPVQRYFNLKVLQFLSFFI